MHTHGVPDEFPEAVVEEANNAKAAPAPREDLTRIPLITIDPEDARDHDDAVYAESDGHGGWRVIVAIADVAAYVRVGTALDREAYRRGNSTYFPDRVSPMLPEHLSANLCSLKENELRETFAVEISFNAGGHKTKHRFIRGKMRSAAKLSYRQAQDAIDGRPDDKTGPLLETVLKPLWEAYRTVSKARDHRAPLDLDLPERRVRIGEDGKIASISMRDRFDAHRLIEEFMIQANVCAAETLEDKRTPLVYRVHEEPSEEKVNALSQLPANHRPQMDARRKDHRPALQPSAGRCARLGERAPRQRDGAAHTGTGALCEREPRPFRPQPIEIRPLHLAHPPLLGPHRPPRPDPRAGPWAGRHDAIKTPSVSRKWLNTSP